MPTIKKDGQGAGEPHRQPNPVLSFPAPDSSGAGMGVHKAQVTTPSRRPNGFHRAICHCSIIVNQPLRLGIQSFTGLLLGAMFDRGSLLNFRVQDSEGDVWFVPQHWTELAADLAAWQAGIPLPNLRDRAVTLEPRRHLVASSESV